MENWFSISFLTCSVVTMTSISQDCPKLNVVMLTNCSVAWLSHAVESLEVSTVATSSASSREERNVLSHHIFIRDLEAKEKNFFLKQKLRGIHNNSLRMKGKEQHVKATDSTHRTDPLSTQQMRNEPQAQLRLGQELVTFFRKTCEVESN